MIPGDVLGLLTMLRDADPPKYGARKGPYGYFLCACGVTKLMLVKNVTTKAARSCGCLRREHVERRRKAYWALHESMKRAKK
jgi:hypothetical protein